MADPLTDLAGSRLPALVVRLEPGFSDVVPTATSVLPFLRRDEKKVPVVL
jgi:hypothetical protein